MPGSLECIAKVNLTKQKWGVAGKQGLLLWANNVMRISQNDYCPVLTGALKGSGKVLIDSESGDKVVVRLTYTKKYAGKVHELNRPHKHGSMKYLATPFNLQTYLLLKQIENELKKTI